MFYPLQDLFQNQALRNAGGTRHSMQTCSLQHWNIAISRACRSDDNVKPISFWSTLRLLVIWTWSLLRESFKGSWPFPSTTWVWPADGFLQKCIGCIGLWTASHLWYYDNNWLFSSLDGMPQKTSRNPCMFLLDWLKLLLFAKCSWNQ